MGIEVSLNCMCCNASDLLVLDSQLSLQIHRKVNLLHTCRIPFGVQHPNTIWTRCSRVSYIHQRTWQIYFSPPATPNEPRQDTSEVIGLMSLSFIGTQSSDIIILAYEVAECEWGLWLQPAKTKSFAMCHRFRNLSSDSGASRRTYNNDKEKCALLEIYDSSLDLYPKIHS